MAGCPSSSRLRADRGSLPILVTSRLTRVDVSGRRLTVGDLRVEPGPGRRLAPPESLSDTVLQGVFGSRFDAVSSRSCAQSRAILKRCRVQPLGSIRVSLPRRFGLTTRTGRLPRRTGRSRRSPSGSAFRVRVTRASVAWCTQHGRESAIRASARSCSTSTSGDGRPKQSSTHSSAPRPNSPSNTVSQGISAPGLVRLLVPRQRGWIRWACRSGAHGAAAARGPRPRRPVARRS
jgi:hypothetical protein